MHFLDTIDEADESEALLQEPEEGSQEESDEDSPHGFRKSRQETDWESYKSTLAYSEQEPVSQETHGDHNSSTGLASGALKEKGKQDEQNMTRSSSTPIRSQRRRSSGARNQIGRNSSTPWRSRRTSSSTPGSSQKRTTSAWGSLSSSTPRDVSRSPSAGRMSGIVLGKRGARKTTSSKGAGKSAPSTATRRDSLKRRRRAHPAAGHDDLPAPQWVIDLMFDIEEATRHELTVE